MKRFAHACEPPVIIPVVVVLIDVHFAIVVPAVEGELCEAPPVPLPFEYSRDCILFGIYNALAPHTKYLHFLIEVLHKPLYIYSPIDGQKYSGFMDTGFGSKQP